MGQRERCAYEHSGIIGDDSPVLASRLEVQAGCHNYQQIVFAQHTIKKNTVPTIRRIADSEFASQKSPDDESPDDESRCPAHCMLVFSLCVA